VDIHETTAAEHDAVIGLVLQRCPQSNRALIEAPVTNPAATQDRLMLTATDEGTPVGFAIRFHGSGLPSGLHMEIVAVAASRLGRGIGTRLHDSLTADLPDSAEALVGQVDDQDTRALASVRRWGFDTVQHSLTSRLRLSGLAEPELPAGISVDSSPSLRFDDEAAVEAMLDASQTNPERDHGGPSTLASLRTFVSEGGAEPVAVVLRDRGRPVALSYALVHGDLAQLVYSGVEPTRRGRGLATLVKQCVHYEAARAGATYATTDNEEHNAGIRHVNQRLGYRLVSGAYWVRRPRT
jgi:GNAT superfamily N-acetyltransferase